MRAVVARVKHASVEIEGEITGQISKGFLVLLGIITGDTEDDARRFAEWQRKR